MQYLETQFNQGVWQLCFSVTWCFRAVSISWPCAFIHMKESNWEVVCSLFTALMDNLYRVKGKQCAPKGVEEEWQLVSLIIYRQWQWLTFSQQKQLVSLFPDRRFYQWQRKPVWGSHLHLNKDHRWLCQSPLSKIICLINASTILFFHPLVQISVQQ